MNANTTTKKFKVTIKGITKEGNSVKLNGEITAETKQEAFEKLLKIYGEDPMFKDTNFENTMR